MEQRNCPPFETISVSRHPQRRYYLLCPSTTTERFLALTWPTQSHLNTPPAGNGGFRSVQATQTSRRSREAPGAEGGTWPLSCHSLHRLSDTAASWEARGSPNPRGSRGARRSPAHRPRARQSPSERPCGGTPLPRDPPPTRPPRGGQGPGQLSLTPRARRRVRAVGGRRLRPPLGRPGEPAHPKASAAARHRPPQRSHSHRRHVTPLTWPGRRPPRDNSPPARPAPAAESRAVGGAGARPQPAAVRAGAVAPPHPCGAVVCVVSRVCQWLYMLNYIDLSRVHIYTHTHIYVYMILYGDLIPYREDRVTCWQETAQCFHREAARLAGKGWGAPLGAAPQGKLLRAPPRAGPCGFSLSPARARGRQAREGAAGRERAGEMAGSAPGAEMLPWALHSFSSAQHFLAFCLSCCNGVSLLFPTAGKRAGLPGPPASGGEVCLPVLRRVGQGLSACCVTPLPCLVSCAGLCTGGTPFRSSQVVSQWEIDPAQPFPFLKSGLYMLGFVSISERSRKLLRLKDQVFQKPQA